jgi:hypothetical protein
MCDTAPSHATEELRDACAALRYATALLRTIELLAETACNGGAIRELARLGIEQTINATQEAEWVLHQTVSEL